MNTAIRLKALTINLRHESLEDGPDNWPLRKHRTARLIRDYAPDLCGTQEGRKPQIEQLENLLPSHALSAGHREWDAMRMYPCLFYRPRRLRLLESGDFWLSETPFEHASKSWESAYPRLATWALFESIQEGVRLYCCVTHLDHMSPQARLGQSGVLIEQLTRTLSPAIPLILMGDFNDRPGSPPHQNLLSARGGFRDAWIEAQGNEAHSDTWHGFTGNGERGRLDWILLRGPVHVLDVQILRNTYEDRYPSDHFPVYADLRIQQ